MQRINWVRVILGGLLAGLIINVVEGFVNGFLLTTQWTEVMRSLNKPAEFSAMNIVWFNVAGFLIGIAAVYLYAAFRPRYGAGPGTAIDAALAVWFVGSLIPSIFPVVMGLLPVNLVGIGLVTSLVELIAATLVGAYLYREEPVTNVKIRSATA